MFIEESMRLYPPLPAFGRQAVAEDRIGGFTIEKDAFVILSPWVTHRLASVWDNPEGFDPERFLPERKAARHSNAFFPFAFGPHKCVGAALAMMELPDSRGRIESSLKGCRVGGDSHPAKEARTSSIS